MDGEIVPLLGAHSPSQFMTYLSSLTVIRETTSRLTQFCQNHQK